MYIAFIIIVFILSSFSYFDKLGNHIIKYRKYISYFLYTLSILSFLYLGSLDNHSISQTGEISLDLLWIILFLPILANVFSLDIAKKLMLFRKEIGILMGTLAFIHSLQYFLSDSSIWFWEADFWFYAGELTYLSYGFIALLFVIVLTITSNNFYQRFLNKKWKILHRSVYFLLIFTLLHIIFLKIYGKNGIMVLFETLFPLSLYFILKVLEWKNFSIKRKIIF